MHRDHGLDPRGLRRNGGGQKPSFHVGTQMPLRKEHNVKAHAVGRTQHIMRQFIGRVRHTRRQRRQGAPDGGVDLGRPHGDVRHRRIEAELHEGVS